MSYRVEIKVMPHKELLDPQGKAVLGGLSNLGLQSVTDVRVGKNITLLVEASSVDQAETIAREAAEKLLSNPVMEYFEVAYTEIMDKREKIREILKTHDLNPNETMFVGDMIHDIETARHGGVLDVAVLTGFDTIEKLLPSKPTIIAVDIASIQKML